MRRLIVKTDGPHFASKKLRTVSYQSLLINIEVELFEEIFCGVDCVDTGYLLLNVILQCSQVENVEIFKSFNLMPQQNMNTLTQIVH